MPGCTISRLLSSVALLLILTAPLSVLAAPATPNQGPTKSGDFAGKDVWSHSRLQGVEYWC